MVGWLPGKARAGTGRAHFCRPPRPCTCATAVPRSAPFCPNGQIPLLVWGGGVGGGVAEQRTFQIQLEGLIQLLAQNLYAEPEVFLREMIQNAHDSIKRRGELARERREQEPPPARIQVVIDPAAAEIHIHANGSGLTEEEIDGYLSTIGRSGTDELRQRLTEADRGRTVELIGQFGIGLLSAFIVADRVTVVTKAAGHEALRWESCGGSNYTVRPGHREQVGTTVTLHVTPDHSRYLDRERLESIIRTYADFIGMPVYVNGDAEPVNAPWHRGTVRIPRSMSKMSRIAPSGSAGSSMTTHSTNWSSMRHSNGQTPPSRAAWETVGSGVFWPLPTVVFPT
jgi:HSP90 family molecular chaperone